MRVDDATQQRQLAAGEQRGQLQLDREKRTERLAWIHGGAVNTRHRSREARQHGIGSSESESR